LLLQLFGCSPKCSEEKIFEKRSFDCRRDNVLWCSALENKVSRVVEAQAQVFRTSFERRTPAASSLAQTSRKKSKKAVKKVVSSEVQRVPSAFNDNLFMEPASQPKRFFLLALVEI
jgi:hypothetical protein